MERDRLLCYMFVSAFRDYSIFDSYRFELTEN